MQERIQSHLRAHRHKLESRELSDELKNTQDRREHGKSPMAQYFMWVSGRP